METAQTVKPRRPPWNNKGKFIGQKAAFKPRVIWALQACDLVAPRVRDFTHGNHVASRATIRQKKTGHPSSSAARA